MSIFDVVEIAEWREKYMSCQMCRYYNGLKQYCYHGHLVHDASISIACDDYQYNGELKSDKEN